MGVIDREKVIKGLEETESMLAQAVNRGGEMAVMGAFKCLSRVTVALVFLKEEPVKPVVNVDEWICGCCGSSVEQQRIFHPNAIFHDFFEYCPHCGKKVDWEAVEQDE